MKIILFIFLTTGSLTFAQQSTSKTALAAKFSLYIQQDTESVEGDVEKDYHDLAQVTLNEQDLPLVQDALLILIKLDKEDPSRTSVQILAQAYLKNQKLFRKAFSIITTSENKDVVQDIEAMMKSFGQDGNG